MVSTYSKVPLIAFKWYFIPNPMLCVSITLGILTADLPFCLMYFIICFKITFASAFTLICI